MAPSVRLDDQSAWDDSALVDSWEEAVAEYQKYHSISKSGKRLEDVLTKKELEELRQDYQDVMEGDALSGDGPSHGAAVSQEHNVDEAPRGEHARDGAAPGGPATKNTTEIDLPHEERPSAAIPHALLGSIKDENLKNAMMSWYYAGYYTGLAAGQQTAPDKAPGARQKP